MCGGPSGDKRMCILGIDEITFGSADLGACRSFFQDLGLSLKSESAQELVFETLNGGRVVIAHPSRPGLPSGIESDPTAREVVWGVSDAASLADLRARLAGRPGFVDDGVRLGCTDPNGVAVRFQVSVKHAVDARGTPSNTWDRRERIDQPGTIYTRAVPIEVGHVVFFVADLAATQAFYESLGFVASDRYPGRGTFMRCAPRGGHHDMFLLQTPDGRRGLNHVAYTVRDIHEVFGGGLQMGRCGWETQLGPGRHPISSAYFWYFRSPAGALAEYYADEDELTEAWKARDFEPGPTVFAEWAIDGGIDGHTRRQKGRKADDRFLTDKRD